MNLFIWYIVRFIVEVVSVLGVGFGNIGLVNDCLVVWDVNGFFYILGISFVGVLCYELENIKEFIEEEIDGLFGF